PMTSDGDRTRASLASLGGTGVFAANLRRALLAGERDAVAHSLKDLPSTPRPGLRIAATPAREDPGTRSAPATVSLLRPCLKAHGWVPAHRGAPPSCAPAAPSCRCPTSAGTWRRGWASSPPGSWTP